MAQPKIIVNNSSINFRIFRDCNKTNQIGELYPNELAVWTDGYTGACDPYEALTSELGWSQCDIEKGEYSIPNAYGSQFAQWSINTSRHVFYVRRKCRIWRGSTEILSVYSGDAICTDGRSDSALNARTRLSINGYRKGGTWHYEDGLWCDTDIEVYSSSPTVYGSGW